tara:strand:- start:4188 stop:5033 length:846 start_codon:yes stop_codon:yes gene_type:complete
MLCTLCSDEIGPANVATFPCGHSFHLSCVFAHTFKTTCSVCDVTSQKLPDLGTDREIAMTADIEAKIKQRQLKPNEPMSFMQKLTAAISPLTPKARTFSDYIHHNTKLSVIREHGFDATDAVQERIPWSKIDARYSGTDILDFGFEWDHMVDMGIVPSQLNKFTWTQQQHKLQLDAKKLLSIRMTVSELARLRYTSHQLIDMGFDWTVMTRMGATVDTWPLFKLDISDIKRYWSPNVAQWVASGFYDKERLERAGWSLEDVLETLPAVTERCNGRVLRLAF